MKKRDLAVALGMIVGSAVIILLGYIFGDYYAGLELQAKCIWLLCVLAYCVWSWVKTTHRVCSLYFFFLLYSIMTNAGQLILYALDVEITSEILVIGSDNEWLTRAIDYQIIGTICMNVGALLSWGHNSEKNIPSRLNGTNDAGRIDKQYKLSNEDIFFLVVSCVQIAMSLSRLESRVDQSYGEAYYSEDTASSLTLIVKFAFYITLFSACVRHGDRKDYFRKVIFIIAALYGLAAVLYGSRNVIIPLVFGLLFLLRQDIKAMKLGRKILFIVLVVAGILFLSAFATIRDQSLSALSFTEVIQEMFGKGILDPIVVFVSEMGGSTRVLTYTMRVIDKGIVAPENTILYTLAKGFLPTQLLAMLGFDEPAHWRLATWITKVHESDHSGWGYSMFAEAYFNFRHFAYIFLALWGYVYVWLERHIEKWFTQGKNVQAAAWLLVAAYAIFLARAETALVTLYIRYAFYVTIGCFMLRKVRFKI